VPDITDSSVPTGPDPSESAGPAGN
jgi:hypothetical protein